MNVQLTKNDAENGITFNGNNLAHQVKDFN